MDDDWDLQAVVRSCATTTTSSTSTIKPTSPPPPSAIKFQSFSSFQPESPQNENFPSLQDLFEPRTERTDIIEELYDLFKPFIPKSSPQNVPVSPLSVLGSFQDLQPQEQQQQQQQVQLQQQLVLPTQLHQQKQPPSRGVARSCNTSGPNGTAHTHSPRSKRRKNQMKRVCQVPAEGLSSDMWSWRKYGQKPIKGSPYPRGYYRCSTSKGCLARKQVERNRSDPNMFIVTYTGEHNHPMPTHRNSLAGSTRQKPTTPQSTTADDPNKPTSSPENSPETNLSPAPEKMESSRDEKEDMIEDDDDDFSLSDMPLDDDFFAGLDDELLGPGAGHNDCFTDHIPAATQFPWLTNSATTTAADGG